MFNGLGLMRQAALSGAGPASLPEDVVAGALAEGPRVRVLANRRPPPPGCHLRYPSRREPSLASRLVLEALQSKGGDGVERRS